MIPKNSEKLPLELSLGEAALTYLYRLTFFISSAFILLGIFSLTFILVARVNILGGRELSYGISETAFFLLVIALLFVLLFTNFTQDDEWRLAVWGNVFAALGSAVLAGMVAEFVVRSLKLDSLNIVVSGYLMVPVVITIAVVSVIPTILMAKPLLASQHRFNRMIYVPLSSGTATFLIKLLSSPLA